MSQNRPGALGMIGRGGIGVLAVALAAGAVGASTLLDPAAHSQAADAPQITAAATLGGATLVCDDSLLAVGRDAKNAQGLSVAATLKGAVQASEDTAERDLPIAGAEDALTRSVSVASDAGRIAGTSSVTIADDDLTGFAVSACRPTAAEGWLVGLDVRSGMGGVITLANPSDVIASVTLTPYGAAGPAAQTTTASIPPHTTTALPIASVVGSELSPVVHLHAEGAPVLAHVQSSVVRSLDPAGIDIQDPVASPALRQIMPGVTVVNEVKSLPATTVRLLATDVAGTASIDVYDAAAGADAKPVRHAEAELVGGIPTDVQIESLPVGDYTVVVTGSSELVAAVQQITGGATGDDVAWYPAVPTLRGSGDFTVAAGADARLFVTNRGSEDATVALPGGEEITLAPGAAEARSVEAGELQSVAVEGGEVYAAVSYAEKRSIATAGVWSVDQAAEPVRITR